MYLHPIEHLSINHLDQKLMGIFDSFFGPKVDQRVSDVAVSETVPKIQASQSVSEVRQNIQIFGGIDHPTIQYTLGVACLMFGMNSEAQRHYLLGAKHGLVPGSVYYESPHADSIGQSLTHLLTQFNLRHNNTVEKATALAYLHLSKCISKYGPSAYDSHRTRAILIKDHESPHAVDAFVMAHFMGQLKEVLMLTDFFKSAQGFVKVNPSVARDNISSATALHHSLDDMSIAGRDADEYSLPELAEIGSQRHELAFRKLEAEFLQGALTVTETELKGILT